MNSRLWMLLLTGFLVGGCSVTGSVPEDRFYRVEPEFRGPPSDTPLPCAALTVDAVSANPLHSGRAVLFRDQDRPLQLQRYHYVFWTEQPPKMVQQVLQKYLREARIAGSVREGGSLSGSTDCRLDARLLRFERVVGKGRPAVDVELEVSFRERSTVWTRTYRRQMTAAGDDMYATAAAMQEALAGVFAELLEDLEQSGADSG